jgi:hypothetical protein
MELEFISSQLTEDQIYNKQQRATEVKRMAQEYTRGGLQEGIHTSRHRHGGRLD